MTKLKLTLGLLGFLAVSTIVAQRSAHAAVTSNGFTQNGWALNGWALNGWALNGLTHHRLVLGHQTFDARTIIRTVSGIDPSRSLSHVAKH